MIFPYLFLLIFWINPTSPGEWECTNTLEISCDGEDCTVAQKGDFTPMRIHVDDDSGSMSVCAYTGCWEGTGTITKTGRLVVFTSQQMRFSTAPDPVDESIAIAIDRDDGVGTIKAGAFAQPILCKPATGSP